MGGCRALTGSGDRYFGRQLWQQQRCWWAAARGCSNMGRMSVFLTCVCPAAVACLPPLQEVSDDEAEEAEAKEEKEGEVEEVNPEEEAKEKKVR